VNCLNKDMEGEIKWRIDSYFEFLAEANADHDGQGVVCGLRVIGLHLDTQQFHPQKQQSHKQGGADHSKQECDAAVGKFIEPDNACF
jgi:hypothetical protein